VLNGFEEKYMETDRMHVAQGYIGIVQEQRFRLITDAGQGLLLTLAHDAPLDDKDLRRLHDANLHVVVEYEGEPNLDSGVAHSIKLNNQRSA
jgi:hypothetical protein